MFCTVGLRIEVLSTCGRAFSPVSGNVKEGHFEKYLKIRETSYIISIRHVVSKIKAIVMNIISNVLKNSLFF